MEYKYFNKYPFYNGVSAAEDANGNAIDMNSIKECISNFNDAMLQSNMIRTNHVGQLDFKNFPDFNYLNYLAVSGEFGTVLYTYPPLIYTFNDIINAEHPLYLKFEFYYYFIHSNTKSSKMNAIVLAAKLTLSKMETFDISQSFNFTRQQYIAGSASDRVVKSDIKYYAYSEIINYKNNLFLNICPNYSVNVNSYGANMILSLINFNLYRSDDGFVIINAPTLTISVSTSVNTAYVMNISNINSATDFNVSTYMLGRDGYLYSESDGSSLNTMVQNGFVGRNIHAYAAATTYSFDKHYINHDVLIVNRKHVANESKFANVKIHLPDGTQGKYKVVAFPAYPMRLHDDAKCFLIRIE